jgi:hypothetical protein
VLVLIVPVLGAVKRYQTLFPCPPGHSGVGSSASADAAVVTTVLAWGLPEMRNAFAQSSLLIGVGVGVGQEQLTMHWTAASAAQTESHCVLQQYASEVRSKGV